MGASPAALFGQFCGAALQPGGLQAFVQHVQRSSAREELQDFLRRASEQLDSCARRELGLTVGTCSTACIASH